ncbi:MAG: hypothetical protein ACE5IY_13150 [bacterium]
MSVLDKLKELQTDVEHEIAGIDAQIKELKDKRKQLVSLRRTIVPQKRRGRKPKIATQ